MVWERDVRSDRVDVLCMNRDYILDHWEISADPWAGVVLTTVAIEIAQIRIDLEGFSVDVRVSLLDR